MSCNLPEALEAYRAAWLILAKTDISIKEIDAQKTGLGLIGPGNGRLTRLLEILFRWSSTFRLHALYHDVSKNLFGNEDTSSETVYLEGHLYLDI